MNAIEITGLRKAYPDFELAGLDLCLPGGCIMVRFLIPKTCC